MKIATGQAILFIEDSITDNGRRGANAPLGGGFVKLFADLLIIARTKAALPHCKILLVDPFYTSTDRAPTSFRGTVQKLLAEYLQVVEDLAKRHNTLHVKTNAIFQQLLETHEPDTFCAEPVHANPTGHLVIADAIYKALTQG